jgi:hypothetical protein
LADELIVDSVAVMIEGGRDDEAEADDPAGP